MLQDILDNAKEKMRKSCEVYERDMMGLRAGRANPKLLDRIMVDYYGTPTPIPQVGNISSPEPRLLVIAPWEAKLIPQIEKAIQKSDLGLNPSNDGKIIRLVFPELNEERRRDLTKVASKGAEDTKVAIRSIRRDAIEQIKKVEEEQRDHRGRSAGRRRGHAEADGQGRQGRGRDLREKRKRDHGSLTEHSAGRENPPTGGFSH